LNSNECDRVVRLSITDDIWSPDTINRTCAEYPQTLYDYPRLISDSSVLYNHEVGNDADGQSMPWSLESNFRQGGKNSVIVSGFIPDSIQTGDIGVNFSGYLWPQSSDKVFDKDYVIHPNGIGNSPRIDTQLAARYWKYIWSGNSLGQNWIMGAWSELVQKSETN
jgi:hypothetical protein